MGFNPFKSIKKIVKKVGKGIKKIGKGLKKVMSKIAKPFAKLGIVGQVALGFLMPWAAGAVWQGLTGTAFSLTSMGTVAGNLTASSNLFAKAAGYVMKGVHWGATKVRDAYQFVSDKISGGINELTGKAKETIGPNADAGDLIKDAVDNGPEIDASIIDKNLAEQAREKELGVSLDVDDATKVTSEAVNDEVIEKNLFQQAKDSFMEELSKAPETLGKQVVTSAATGIGDMIEQGIAGNDDMGGYASYEVPDFLSLDARSAYTKYNEVDFALMNKGYAYGGPSYNANILNSDFGTDAYFNFFNQFGQGGND